MSHETPHIMALDSQLICSEAGQSSYTQCVGQLAERTTLFSLSDRDLGHSISHQLDICYI